MMGLAITLLRDMEHGGAADQPARIAAQLARFIAGAKKSLHVAVYDFRLPPGTDAYTQIVNAIRERAAAGVDVRIAFDAGKTGARAGVSPAPDGTAAFLDQAFRGSPVQVCPVTDLNPMHGDPRLMHSKYLVLDGNTPDAVVWTGSVNLAPDAWTFQENNLLTIASPELSRYYETDFQELWQTGNIDSTGRDDSGTVSVGGVTVDVAFSPGQGSTIDARVADLITSAQRRIKIASMLIASRRVLFALQDVLRANRVPEIAGVYDATQMQETIQNWNDVPTNNFLVPLFQEVTRGFAHKDSLPYSPDGKHNFMHDKLVVADDAVLTGSFNLSHSATQNAENIVIVHDAGTADLYSRYVDDLVRQYGAS